MFVDLAGAPPRAVRRSRFRRRPRAILAIVLHPRDLPAVAEAVLGEVDGDRDVSVEVVVALRMPIWWCLGWPMAIVPPTLPHQELEREVLEDIADAFAAIPADRLSVVPTWRRVHRVLAARLADRQFDVTVVGDAPHGAAAVWRLLDEHGAATLRVVA